MGRARPGVVAVLVVVLAGCGGGGHPRRDAVDAYFGRVDRAELPLLTKRGAVNLALQHFSMAGNPPAEVQALRRARATILAAERRVRAIQPPADARKIHVDLLAMLHSEASLTDDLLLTSSYAPQLQRALRPITPAGAALTRDLRTAKGWMAQAAAFAAYRTALQPVLATLGTLHAPPVLEPSLIGEQAALRRRVALCLVVESALTKKDAKGANTAIRSLFAVGAAAVRARQAEIAAARSYNARVTQISVLTAAIARERQKLLREIG